MSAHMSLQNLTGANFTPHQSQFNGFSAVCVRVYVHWYYHGVSVTKYIHTIHNDGFSLVWMRRWWLFKLPLVVKHNPPKSHMSVQMTHQMSTLSEVQSTQVTLEWLLTRMSAQMTLQGYTVSKQYSACVTFEWFLTSMSADVFLQSSNLSKT